MTPERIEELVKEYSDYGYEYLVRQAIITAINETKEEDQRLCDAQRENFNCGCGVPCDCHTVWQGIYACEKAILTSKINSPKG